MFLMAYPPLDSLAHVSAFLPVKHTTLSSEPISGERVYSMSAKALSMVGLNTCDST